MVAPGSRDRTDVVGSYAGSVGNRQEEGREIKDSIAMAQTTDLP
jgi:hypothetical protein